MNIDINVQHTLVDPEELQDREDNVVDVAEARRFGLLGMMQPSGPINRDVGRAIVELAGTTEGATRRDLAELEESIENRAIRLFPNIEFGHLASVFVHVVGGDGFEEIDI